MIVELGHIALILSLGVVILQGCMPYFGFKTGNARYFKFAINGARASFVLLVLAYLAFVSAFLTNDFSLLNVASHSNSLLSWYYKVAASWGSHEGSILFWSLTLSFWTFLLTLTKANDLTKVRVLAILGLVEAGIIAFTLWTSNPFLRTLPFPAEGEDLNPLLQDPGMIFHPPLLYVGYVGFSVPFAFALSALLSGDLTSELAQRMRVWTLSAWIFLTLGIVLGSYWSYYELGWGGWWFWDPVENASLMPWLTGTALIHSLVVSYKRSCFKVWTVFLAILTFSLSLLGTFLVRSGVLTSVHAFAADPERGIFILAFLVIVIGLSFELFAWKAPLFRRSNTFEILSRESGLFINNLLFVVSCAAIFLGTLYPLVLEAISGAKISVGAPYFEKVLTPIFLGILLLLGLTIRLRWKDNSFDALKKHYLIAFLMALIGAALVFVLVGKRFYLVITLSVLTLCVFLLFSEWLEKKPLGHSVIKHLFRFSAFPRFLAHFGLVVFVVGVVISSAFSLERDARMHIGESLTVGEYVFTMKGIEEKAEINYKTVLVSFEVKKKGEKIPIPLVPEKRQYYASGMVMTEVAIKTGLLGDLYVSLGDMTHDAGWVVRAYFKPCIDWIWWGVLLMAAGGVVLLARMLRDTLKRKER